MPRATDACDVCDERVKGDEVEDLRALLAAVVREMPNVKAVTSGAILSDYQRLRVEAVCADLGLVSLAYLWRQPQGQEQRRRRRWGQPWRQRR